jgi:uncharacterized protein YfaS (alpha-2-macroglobulin family)
VQPAAWSSPRAQTVPLAGLATPLQLPADARNLRVSFAQGAASHFARIAEDLIDYPYGGVEQTASRIIPLTMAANALPPDGAGLRDRLLASLQNQRLRLVSMAGPDAVFGWWGNGTQNSALMTAYAYFADWYAARALKIELPPEHWDNLLKVYGDIGVKDSIGHRALVLWMAREMGLPTKTLASGLVDDVTRALPQPKAGQPGSASMLLGADDGASHALALGLVAVVANANGIVPTPPLQEQFALAWKALRDTPAPAAQALLVLAGEAPAGQAESILASVRADAPTFDRAFTLLWLQKKLGGDPFGKPPVAAPQGPWRKVETAAGQALWRWMDAKTLPTQLQLAAAAPAGTVAVLQYDSRAAETPALPVTVERRILRMKRVKAGYETEPVKAGEALRTDELYLDEIRLKPAAGGQHRYGLVEVPLPPGANVEPTTWGIVLALSQPQPLERARHAERPDGYAVPVDPLDGEVVVRHLLRFAQKGSYVVPPARYHRVYQPEQKAFEAGGKARTLKVE